MKLRWWEIGMIGLVLVSGACTGNGQPLQSPGSAAPLDGTTVTPSEAPPTVVPTWTPFVLPPTWTLSITYTPSITPTPSLTLTPSPTLTLTPTETPTLTPSLTNTPTITKTPTPDLTNAALLAAPLAPECATFAADPEKNQRDFTFGDSPTVYWTPVENAAAYLVRLLDDDMATVEQTTTTETSYTFDAELFNLEKMYTWNVAPVNVDGLQMCPVRGSALIPSP